VHRRRTYSSKVPVKMSESAASIGGGLDRGAATTARTAPTSNGELLGMSTQDFKSLAEEGVI
jgi:hypothetical protein